MNTRERPGRGLVEPERGRRRTPVSRVPYDHVRLDVSLTTALRQVA